MFTNNYITFRQSLFLGSYATYTYPSGSKTSSFGPNCGANADIGAKMAVPQCREPAATYGGVYFGTGTTAPQKTDYKLESYITSGLSFSGATRNYQDEGNGKHSYVADFVVRNTSDAAITISEIGYHGSLEVGASSYTPVLFERTVLDRPITIPAGESKLVSYKITFNHG